MENTNALINSLGITMVLTPVPNNPNMDSKDMFNYHVMLKFEGRVFTTYFSTGAGWIEPVKNLPKAIGYGFNDVTSKDAQRVSNYQVSYNFTKKCFESRQAKSVNDYSLLQKVFTPKLPKISDILECLMLDSSVLDYSNFSSWANDFGYSDDSIKAKKIYEACIENALGLKNFLGNENLEKLREAIDKDNS